MKSEYPFTPTSDKKKDELMAPASRFIDEKISDDSGTETQTNSALQPAGLDNPFWN
jgi:hypothetical protein